VFALSLTYIIKIFHSRIFLVFVLALQFVHIVNHHEYITERNYSGISFQSYFSTELFREIENNIGINKNSYVVASIGLHPAVAQYNGFQTADAYLSLYPLEYKRKFRKAVVTEFSRRPELLSYYDDWGSRAYFFSSELLCPRNGSFCLKNKQYKVNTYEMNMEAVKELGVRYFFSIPDIGNHKELGLVDLGRFEDPTAAWSIRVYEVS
jgi:hypothetical protein